jgi:general secretion pathway protein I
MPRALLRESLPCLASRGLAAPKLAGPRPAGAGGFTFIEVLVALAIFALSGLVLASAYLNVLTAQAAVLQRNETAADCRLVREALCAEPSLDKVTAWNELALPGVDRLAHWRATLTSTPVADLFDVTLEIELPGPNGRSVPAITQTLRLLRPTWSQPADRDKLRAAARSKLALRTYQ